MDSQNDFLDQLVYFGAALNGDSARFKNIYVDLEGFALKGTLQLSLDTRVTQAFLLWITRYGCLLSPSKVRRLLREGTHYDPALLGVIIDLISENSHRLQNWSILKKFTKKVKSRFLFPHLPKPSKPQPDFQNWGIIAPPMSESESKYLRPSIAILKTCPELRYRAEGVSPVAADIRAFNDKNHNFSLSLYQIAKAIHHPRAQVNGNYRQLMSLKILATA